MKNRVQDGDSLPYANSSGSQINSGAVVVLPNRCAIAKADIPNNKSGEIALEGVYSLPKKTTDVIAQFTDVYWDADPGEVTLTEAGNKYLGIAAESKGNGATSINVRLQDGKYTLDTTE